MVQSSVVLSKGKGLSSAQLGPAPSLYLCEAKFASRLVLFCTHWYIILRRAARVMIIEEQTIATIKDIDLGKGQIWVSMSVASPVVTTDMFCPA